MRLKPNAALACLLLAALAAAAGQTRNAAAQAAAPVGAAPDTTTTSPATAAAKVVADTDDLIAQGRGLLDEGDPDRKAPGILETAARKSLLALIDAAGPAVLTMPPDQVPTGGFVGDLVHATARAHFWWGKAANEYGDRDAAITALGRATRFAGDLRFGTNDLARDTLLNLGSALREGLPQVAPDDTMDAIATIAHGNLWKPVTFHEAFQGLSFAPTFGSPPLVFGRDFLVTDGKLFPPFPASATDIGSSLSRIPPLYRAVPPDALPAVLKMDKMIVGFVRETQGPNRGMWNQIVRVFYASTYLTRDKRDDRPRAEALCSQFLKIWSLNHAATGMSNRYSPYGVTTLWLSEVSSFWPSDDDDPSVIAAIGPRMPDPNTPLVKITRAAKPPVTNDIESTPLTMPWRVSGQVESAPGEMIFFKMTQPREEIEWIRETAHEYGHISLPPFGGYRPPLEPFGNGALGETLTMLWGAAAPDQFALSDALPSVGISGVSADPAHLAAGFDNHVIHFALPALRFWNAQGPTSYLRHDSTRDGLRYLEGLAVYVDRVYGSSYLGAAFAPLMERFLHEQQQQALINAQNAANAANGTISAPSAPIGVNPPTNPDGTPFVPDLLTAPPPPGADATGLLDAVADTLRDPFPAGVNSLPIWLPGAFDTTAPGESDASLQPTMLRGGPLLNANDMATQKSMEAGAQNLAHRAPFLLHAGDRIACWLFVPATAGALRVEWQGPAGAVMHIEGGWPAAETAPMAAGNSGAALIRVAGRPGWQRFAFTCSAPVSLTAARFERAVPGQL